ncbi:MFS transporter [Pseudomonas vanderleydeniana]|uniref:MFS transporter n=1 Tax=Pseudomonas vanderleydeniana TaxID=2745495 RepID=A0A9E6PHA9_9PSED|nr:MFS transporter [Pseudomonas vanderleydeniana]QXI26215.1 MFS transporter [Pseudomonas vanderleydeniana]
MSLSIGNTQAGAPSTASQRTLMIALVVLAAITPSLLMTAPAVAAQLASQWGLAPAQIGNLFMAELGAMSLATLPAFWWLKRIDLRRAGLLAGALFIVGNLLSAWVSDYSLLMLMRMAAGLGGGSLMILCMVSAALMNNGSRVYGFWVLGQLVLGALGLQVLPLMFARYGLVACYLSLAILMAVALPLVRTFPVALGGAVDQPRVPIAQGRAALGILAILCFYVSLSGVWTFIGAIASRAAINPQDSGQVLAIATLMGIVGAGCTAVIGDRLPRTALLILGYGLMIGAVLLLQDQPTALRFACAALIFKFTWTFVLPLILAYLAELDPSGRLMNLTNLVIGAGLAIGPGIAGHLIQASGDYRSTLLGAAALTLLSLLLILAGRRSRATASSHP